MASGVLSRFRLFRSGTKDTKELGDDTTHALTWQTTARSGNPPSVRNGHTADVIDSRIFVFGGGDKAELLADLHVFDAADSTWSQPPCTGMTPPPRSRHSSAVIEKSLYIWGGIGGGVDVHILDTVMMDWSVPNVTGTVPDSRFGHTCAAIDVTSSPRLLVLGGHNSRQALSDVHVLEFGIGDDEHLSWTKPHVLGEAPICGNRHAAVLIEDHHEPMNAGMLVFAADMHDTFGTLYSLRVRDGLQAKGYRWVAQPTAGRPPLSRARPSLSLLDRHVFMVCGVAAGKPLSTVAMLDRQTFSWSLPTVDGVPPPSRMGATCSRVGTDLFIFGGSDGKSSLRDLNVLVYVTWFTPSYGGRAPPPRVGHTLNVVGSKLYLLGGAYNGTATNDLFVLDPAAQSWTRPPMYGAPPDALIGHSAATVGVELVVWGGGDGRRSHSGLNVVDTANMLWSRPAASGSEPLAHVGHSAVHTDSKMFLFGGYGQRQYWNELVVLETGIMVWIRPHTSGTPPQPCVSHTANLVWSQASGWMMVVYGGAFDEKPIDQLLALEINSMRWTNIGNLIWDGIRPEPRFGHCAAAIGPKIFVFGGTTGAVADKWTAYLKGDGFVTGYAAGASNELCVIDLQHRQFTTPRYGGHRPPPTYRLASVALKGKLFLYGGVGGDGQVALLDTGLQEQAAGVARGEGGSAASAGGAMLEAATAELHRGDVERTGSATGTAGTGTGHKGDRSEPGKGLNTSEAAALVALLQELGLNKYARLFLRQEVDVDSLLHLSDRDLKEMGLTAIGARRKLTAAIHRHKLQSQVGADIGGGGAPLPSVGGSMPAGVGGGAADSGGVAIAGQIYRGRYNLRGRTYLGGSARVVLGEDVKTGSAIAVKVHLSRAYFTREVKLLKHLRSEFVVALMDAYDEEESPPSIILEGGSLSLSEHLSHSQLSHVERKLILERLCLIVDFVHSKNLVIVDLKPQNLVIFGSLLTLKLIDLECLRKVGENIPFKLTPFYAAPELAAAAVETMRRGQLPTLEYRPGGAEGGEGELMAGGDEPDRWGPNLHRHALQPENPTLARQVAAASHAASRAGDGSQQLNRDDIKQLEAPLLLPSGKPLRAQPAMDIWAVGMIAYELFVNEPYFAGCSDDVALQVLASNAPLEMPAFRIAEAQAEHLLSRVLVKRAKERLPIGDILRHAFLVGGLDTQEVGGSFAMLHESQQAFKNELTRLQDATGGGLAAGASFAKPPARGDSFVRRDGGRSASFAPELHRTLDSSNGKARAGASVLDRIGMQ